MPAKGIAVASLLSPNQIKRITKQFIATRQTSILAANQAHAA